MELTCPVYEWMRILDDQHRVVKPDNWEQWFDWCERNGGISVRVASDRIGVCEIITSFISTILNPDWNLARKIVKNFETAIFTSSGIVVFARYSTWQDALEGHKEAVGCVLNNQPPYGQN